MTEPNPAQPATPETSQANLLAAWLVIGGAGALLLGSLLPWAKVNAGIFSATKNGMEGDGVLTFFAAIAIAALGYPLFRDRLPTWRAIVPLVIGVLALFVCIYDMVDVENRAADLEDEEIAIDASIGEGLYLAAVGAGAVVWGTALATRDSRQRAAPPPPAAS